MKNYSKFLVNVVLTYSCVLSLIYQEGLCQDMTTGVLIAEHRKDGRQIALDLGMTVRYKTYTSEEYKKGELSGFTDSSMTLENRMGSITLLNKDLRSIKVPRKKNTGRIIVGSGFLTIAAIMVYGAATAPNDDLSTVASGLAITFIAIPSFIIGRSILKPKVLNLKRSWSLKTIKVAELNK